MDSTTTKSNKLPVTKPVPVQQPETKPPVINKPPPMITNDKATNNDDGMDSNATSTIGGAAVIGVCAFMCLAVCLLVFLFCVTRTRFVILINVTKCITF